MICLSTILPCFNEEDVLPLSLEHLTKLYNKLIDDKKISPKSTIVFVNDGSTDRTWDVICSLKSKNNFVRGINLAHNVGHQNAILAGMMTAREWSDGVITIDADLQDDFQNCIPQMIDDYENGYDVVYGVKTDRNSDPLLKRLTAQAFYKLQKKMGVECIYNHADFRFMSKKALDALSHFTERNIYLRGIIPLMGFKSTTVSDILSERLAGKSKYNGKKMIGLAIDGITSFSVKPIYIIVIVGIAFLIMSIIILFNVCHALINGVAVPGWASLILSIWIVGGSLMVSIGVVGIYIGKIFEEVKHRPRYIISEII